MPLTREKAINNILLILTIQSTTGHLKDLSSIRHIFERYNIHVNLDFMNDLLIALSLYEQIYIYFGKSDTLMLGFINDIQSAITRNSNASFKQFRDHEPIFLQFYELYRKMTNDLTSDKYDQMLFPKELRLAEIKLLNIQKDLTTVIKKYDYYLKGVNTLTLQGHTDRIPCLKELSSKRIVSGSLDNTLRIWDSTTGKLIFTLEGHTDRIRDIALLNNDRIVSASNDHSLRIWNINSGQCEAILRGHTQAVTCVTIYGDRIVSGSGDNTLKIWNPESGEAEATLIGHTELISRIIVTENGKIISAAGDFTIKIWNPITLSMERTLVGHTSPINYIALIGDRIVSGSMNGELMVWNWKTGGAALSRLEGHTDIISAIVIIDREWIISASADNTVKVWNSSTYELKQTFTYDKWVGTLALLLDNRIIAGLGNSKISIMDIENDSVTMLYGHTSGVDSLLVLKDGRIVSGSNDKTIKIWE